jgi:hypothetical protein
VELHPDTIMTILSSLNSGNQIVGRVPFAMPGAESYALPTEDILPAPDPISPIPYMVAVPLLLSYLFGLGTMSKMGRSLGVRIEVVASSLYGLADEIYPLATDELALVSNY